MEIMAVLIVVIVVLFLIQVAILRWIFRVNEIVNCLRQIRDLLNRFNRPT